MRLFTTTLPESAEEKQRGINMVDLMMWLVIAALLLAAAIQGIGYYQQASFTYQAKSDLAGEHTWAAARTALETRAPNSSDMAESLLSGDLKLTGNGGVYNIGIIATTGHKYCLGVKSPSVKGNNVFYSTSDAPNKVMTSTSLPAFCGTAMEVTSTGTATPAPSGPETPSATPSATASATASATPSATASATPSATATASPTPPPPPAPTTVNWVDRSTTFTTNIYSMSASGDLSRLLGGGSGTVTNYLSTNGGTSFARAFTDPASPPFQAGAVSTDGTKMVMGGYDANYAYVYTSIDGGANWVKSGSVRGYWSAFAISSDGTKMVASDGNGGNLWTSSTSGTGAWTRQSNAGTGNTYVAASSDGRIVWAGGSSTTRVSTDYGVNWTTKTSLLGTGTSASIAVSPDGSKVVVGKNGSTGGIYVSTDSGASFTKRVVGTNATQTWTGMGMSADGTKIAVADSNGKEIWFSLDSGATWTKAASLPALSWQSVMVSTDGTKFVAASLTGKIYSGTIG